MLIAAAARCIYQLQAEYIIIFDYASFPFQH
jgi:hypothetical protein